ncbi:MAG TPA: 50S ribosomal protein L5 [Candidatus Pacebacteria bacterium]|nr:50S ribosomal protein L5 [Candidatus Paceibacterota bacterium]
MNRLKQKYQTSAVQALKAEFKHANLFEVAKIQKITLNMGVADPQEPRAREKVVESVVAQFAVIAGQKPQITRAKKAISNFKLRAGDPMGVMVTLRGELMWEFLDKLIFITLPRVKDFRGVSRTAFDGQGNYSLGLEEQIAFPEIDYDKIDKIRSLQVNITLKSQSQAESFRLLELLGMPFMKVAEIEKN